MKVVYTGGNIEESNILVNNKQNLVEASTDNQPSWWKNITNMLSSKENTQTGNESKESNKNEPMTGGKKKRKVTKRKKSKQRKTARKPRSKAHKR